MKIIATAPNMPEMQGLASTFTALEYNFMFWDKKAKPTFDMFDEIKPDVIILTAADVDQTVVAALQEYKATKVVFFGVTVPDGITPSLMSYPRKLSTPQLAKINSGGLPYVQIQPAADVAKFSKGKYNKQHTSEILYITGLPYQETLIPHILCSLLDYDIKIVGPRPIPFAEYVGNVNLKILCDLMKSTQIGLDFMGLHTLDYAANKVFCLSSDKNDVVPYFTQESYKDDIARFLNNHKLMDKHIESAYDHVISSHTYFHRTADVLNGLGYDKEAKKCIEYLEKHLND